MAYKTCPDCGSRIFNHGCVNCDEMDYISMQGAYDTKEKSERFLCALSSEKRCDKQCFTCSEDEKCDNLNKSPQPS